MDKNFFFESGALISLSADKILAGWGNFHWLKAPQDPPQASFYFPDFFLKKETPWLVYENQQIFHISQILSLLNLEECLDPLKNNPFSDLTWTIPCKDFFFRSFFNLKKLFASGSLQKAVPYIIEETDQKMTPLQLSKSLAKAIHYVVSQPGYIYGFWNKHEGLLGVTPEILFSVEKDTHHFLLQSIALAGSSKEMMSLYSQKNLEEHALVIQGISKALAALGQPTQKNTHPLILPNIIHLMTEIVLELNYFPSFSELVQILHPTPALGTHPRNAGWPWLKEYEKNVPRMHYGAPVGLQFHDSAKCYVAIRNVQWNNSGMKIGAGCGIIAKSTLEDEWKEIQMKLYAIKEILAL